MKAKGVVHSNHPCPVCGYYTLDLRCSEYDICPVCWWENDWVQLADPKYAGGANQESLLEARDNYQKYGWSESRARSRIRAPLPEEGPPLDVASVSPRDLLKLYGAPEGFLK